MEFTEQRETREKVETAQEILRLLSELIEKGGDWDPQEKQRVRAKIDAGLSTLGVTSIAAPRFYDILHSLDDVKPSLPKDYPSFEEFVNRYEATVANTERQDTVNWEQSPTLEELIKLSYIEGVTEVEGRDSIKIRQYLYNLGREMCNERSYRAAFPANDNISVYSSGWIQNGRHRTLALKCLDAGFVNKHNFDRYIKVDLEKE